MASINDLINQVENPELKAMLQAEVRKLTKKKKFGLVFENHMPECTPLYDVPIKVKSLVAKKDTTITETYTVVKVDGDILTCMKDKEIFSFNKNDMVCIAKFGEPIYPYLQPIDKVCNAPDSKLWHTLIEADNYHALQLLEYLYAGKVDCIYIDPPYNNGSKDWKYNNDYVDKTDSYRHSKWLSLIQKRLLLAKKLLNPDDSVLIVTIDEKEYLHLGCLLEEIFPKSDGDANNNYKGRCKIQMISTVIANNGNARAMQFARNNEYIFFIMLGKAGPQKLQLDKQWLGNIKVKSSKSSEGFQWGRMLRGGNSGRRSYSPGCFYPIYIDNEGFYKGIGEPIPLDVDRHSVKTPENLIAIWPIHLDGSEGCWSCQPSVFKELFSKGYIKFGDKITERGVRITYIQTGMASRIDNGEIRILGRGKNGTVILDTDEKDAKYIPAAQWSISEHDATYFGSNILTSIIGKQKFTYPKSLYAVHDCLRFFLEGKKDALVVDFFAGSGTTLHAINLLNYEDDGNRRCIIVTNNEVSEKEETKLRKQHRNPGDPEWESLGIARYATWPRTQCSILGVDIHGIPLSGEYYTTKKNIKQENRNIKQISINVKSLCYELKKGSTRPEFSKTKYKKVLKSIVSLMGKDALPQSLIEDDSKYLISESAKYMSTILLDVEAVDEWLEELSANDHILNVYIVTEDNKVFNAIKKRVLEVMEPIVQEEVYMYPMSNGFKSNVEYFKLGFVDERLVSLGRKFKEILPIIWLKSGAYGPRPILETPDLPEMLIPEHNNFAVLIDESYFAEFTEAVKNNESIRDLYFVTDSPLAYAEMVSKFDGYNTCQLYKDYLDNFRINVERR